MSDEKKKIKIKIINKINKIIIIIVIPVSGCPGWRVKRRKDEDLVGCVLLVN